MRASLHIMRYAVTDIVRTRWILVYFGFFLGSAWLLLQFGGGLEKSLLGMSNLVLTIVPLVSILFATVYTHRSREFIELLLVQPIQRASLYWAIYVSLTVPLAASVLIGVGLPLVVNWSHLQGPGVALLPVSGAVLTAVFTAVGLYLSVAIRDRLKGLGAAMFLWLTMAVVYDGLVLLLTRRFAEYPVEGPLLALTALNPIDLARVAFLLQTDAAALMGYTGAIFEDFFGSSAGASISLILLGLWAVVPAFFGRRVFDRKDH